VAIDTSNYVVGESFYTEWKSGMDCSKSSWPLTGLSPSLIEIVRRSPETTRTVRISLALIASSAVVFFSEYNKAIPLLAPFLLGLGSWWLINSVRKVVPRRWTEVRKLSGETNFSIVQPDQRTDEWVKFEEELSETIREINAEKT
jgi:hypothetical protein